MRYSGGFMRLGDDEVEGERENEESDEPVDIDNPPPFGSVAVEPNSR